MKSTPELRRTFRVIASPRARRALRQKGFEAKTIRGSGPGGRILESDVLAHVPKHRFPKCARPGRCRESFSPRNLSGARRGARAAKR